MVDIQNIIVILNVCKLLITRLFIVKIKIMKNITKSVTVLFLLTSVFYFSQQKSNALVNTEWKGVANIPTPLEINFKFGTDSVDLVYQGMVVEKMKYGFTSQGELTLLKLEGNSPCNSQDVGIYKYKTDKDVLTLTSVNDKCEDRKTAFDGNNYGKVQQTTLQ